MGSLLSEWYILDVVLHIIVVMEFTDLPLPKVERNIQRSSFPSYPICVACTRNSIYGHTDI